MVRLLRDRRISILLQKGGLGELYCSLMQTQTTQLAPPVEMLLAARLLVLAGLAEDLVSLPACRVTRDVLTILAKEIDSVAANLVVISATPTRLIGGRTSEHPKSLSKLRRRSRPKGNSIPIRRSGDIQ